MAKTRKQKEEIVGKLEGVLKGTTSVFVGFTGVSVGQESKMRRAMRSDGLGYMVAKKTLIRRALQSLGHAIDVPMPGETAIAYTATSTDATAPAQRVHAFGKEFGEGKLSILGGIFEGRIVDAAVMQEIATIPSLQVLRGMFVQLINSPRQRFAVALGEVAKIKQ
jgi:large subunit ribosomal protein L10